jgi:hypothetical protein
MSSLRIGVALLVLTTVLGGCSRSEDRLTGTPKNPPATPPVPMPLESVSAKPGAKQRLSKPAPLPIGKPSDSR